MIVEDLIYEVKVLLKFNSEEAALLVKLAAKHYDATCQLAGLAIGEGSARENGFIAQLKLFPNADTYSYATWSSRQIELALKVLEPWSPERSSLLAHHLFDDLYKALMQLQHRRTELNQNPKQGA